MKNLVDSKGQFAGTEIVGVASTFYTDLSDPRYQLALENAKNWQENDLPYIIIDGSPSHNDDGQEIASQVAGDHRDLGAVVIRSEQNGIATQRLQGVAYAIANGAEKVVGHEPEKVLMSNFASQIANSLDSNAIVAIGRTSAAMVTLPSTQRWTEGMAGWAFEQTHKLPQDTLSGGRGFNVLGADILAGYPASQEGMNNWIYLYERILAARNAGHNVGSLLVDLYHPKLMTEQEQGSAVFDRKRFDQFKLQTEYMFSRQPIENTQNALAVSAITLDLLSNIGRESSNDEFAKKLQEIEAEYMKLGYQPR